MSSPTRDVTFRRRSAAMSASLGVILLAAATAGCDSTPYPTGEEFTTTVQGAEPSVPGTSYPPSYPDPSPVVLDVDIADGSVQPQNAKLQAGVGQPIELRVDSDAAANIEIEGALDRSFAVKPVADQVFDFTVDNPGTVTVATRQPAQTIATVEIAAPQSQ